MVGRDAELHDLHRAWQEVGTAGQVAAVLGPAGCGKTRLVEEFRQDAQAAGAVVLAGRCHDGESGLPFVLAADLLAVALSVCPELPARLPAHTAAMTGRLCPGLAADYPDDVAPLDSPLALTRLYGAIAEALPGRGRRNAGQRRGGPGRGRALGRRAVPGPARLPGAPAGRLAAAAGAELVHRPCRTARRAARGARRSVRRGPVHADRTRPAGRGADPGAAGPVRGERR